MALEQLTLEGLRILYIASECLLYLWAFHTETHDELVLNTETWRSEEVLQSICDILVKQDSSYEALLDFLEKEADGETCTLGICGQAEVTGKQLAAQILNDAAYLNKPIIIKSGNPPADF